MRVDMGINGSCRCGMARFEEHNLLGVSSSLATPAHKEEYWSASKGSHLVPVLTLKDVIDRIPGHMSIPYAKMDLQGFDFEAVQSAADSLQRIQWLMCECWLGGKCSYEGVANDLARDWYPYMDGAGFEFVKGKENYVSAHCEEVDVLWKRKGVETKMDFVL